MNRPAAPAVRRPRRALLGYRRALQAHLLLPSAATLAAAQGQGEKLAAAGISTVELTAFHEDTLISTVLPTAPAAARHAWERQAARFFALALLPRPGTPGAGRRATAALSMLSQRSIRLAATNQACHQEIAQRKAVEAALTRSERRYQELLTQSDHMQQHLRELSRQILSAQEDERKEISRELHDVIAQTLSGINVRLATLKLQAVTHGKGLDGNIALTQRLVAKSVDIVHRFARELRPAALDQFGLIPALQAYLKALAERTGLRSSLTAAAAVETLDMTRRTVLFRVAQEALTNVARHARATHVSVTIRRRSGGFRMEVHDDGRSFSIMQARLARGGKRLGLIGMRERLAMVGGSFAIASAPGHGTKVTATLPAQAPLRRRASPARAVRKTA